MGTPAFSEAIDPNAPVEKDPKYNPYDYNVKNEKLFRKFDVKNMIVCWKDLCSLPLELVVVVLSNLSGIS